MLVVKQNCCYLAFIFFSHGVKQNIEITIDIRIFTDQHHASLKIRRLVIQRQLTGQTIGLQSTIERIQKSIFIFFTIPRRNTQFAIARVQIGPLKADGLGQAADIAVGAGQASAQKNDALRL